MRIKSLKSAKANYKQLMQFFFDRSEDEEVDSSVSAKASGFLDYMESFECIFYLTMMIEIFDRIEILNKELQKSSLCVIESYEKITAVTDVFLASRDTKFNQIWQKSVDAAIEFEIDEPDFAHQRKVRHLRSNAPKDTNCTTPEQYYLKSYLKVFDQLILSLKSRYDNDAAVFFKSLENFALGKASDLEKIVQFYQHDFNKERLLSDRDMFLQLLKRQKEKAKSLSDVVTILQKYEWMGGLVPEFLRFVQLLIVIPGSSCTNERSFSALRRLKTYLRSTMSQDRLNSIAILHTYADLTEKLDLELLLNKFISKNSNRSKVFALSK